MSYFVFQVKQKLEEHGISNNTIIKWIVQPDGMVFQKLNVNNIFINQLI